MSEKDPIPQETIDPMTDPTIQTNTDPLPEKQAKRKKKLIRAALIFFAWLTISLVLGQLSDGSTTELHIDIMAPRLDIAGIDVSSSVLFAVISTAFLTIVALIIRFAVIPRFKDEPRGIQTVLEIMVETIQKYTDDQSGHLGENLGAYIFTIAALMISAEAFELLGLRPPTADLVMTGSMALVTFFLLNYYGIKKKGLKGRIGSFAKPIPFIFPIKILSDIAIPVSLACRLFGNMLGGMIVVHLLYMALGNFAIGVPAVMGLYFNIFHPLIQAFIFITLSLTFIREAAE